MRLSGNLEVEHCRGWCHARTATGQRVWGRSMKNVVVSGARCAFMSCLYPRWLGRASLLRVRVDAGTGVLIRED